MACCGLCRPKLKTSIKSQKTITRKKIEKIDQWMETIEGPFETIDLPMKSPTKPKKFTNKEEIMELNANDDTSQTSAPAEQSENGSTIVDSIVSNEQDNSQNSTSNFSSNQ